MEEKVFVGYGYGRFKNDRGEMQDYCNVFMLEDFTGSENSDYHFGGQKAVKYRCLKPELFADLAPGEGLARGLLEMANGHFLRGLGTMAGWRR